MLNLFKISKLIKKVTTSYTQGNSERFTMEDGNGDQRLDYVVALYRELSFPFGLLVLKKHLKHKGGRDVLWARGEFDPEYVENTVLPTLIDSKYLKSLAPNTVGAHFYNLTKTWGLDDLFNQRYKESEGMYGDARDEILSNISRHNLLSHDIWHVLFRYDTTAMGEAMIQEVSSHLWNWKPALITSHVVTKQLAKETKSKLPWKVKQECKELVQAMDHSILYQSPISFLEKDIDEVRKQYNIGVPVLYKEFTEKFQDHTRLDTFHPEYNDVEWDTTEVTV